MSATCLNPWCDSQVLPTKPLWVSQRFPSMGFRWLQRISLGQDEVIRRDHDTFTMCELNLIDAQLEMWSMAGIGKGYVRVM